MKFIHIADVHLGVKPDAGKSWSEKRARDIWESFASVIEVAAKEKPDFLFITGDLFHAQPLKKEIREVDLLFRTIPETKVILLAGNHDYLRQKSYYLTYSWVENVCFFKMEEAECFDFPAENVAVYGLSYWHREIRERLYDGLMPENEKRINILLAHGGDERHIPFSATEILRNGFDYVAAGHIHRGEWLAENRAVMAGSLEPTDCNDFGPHGYWMGELEKGKSQVHFFPIQKCEYRQESYAVHAGTSQRELRNWVETLLKERPQYQYFRLSLVGHKAMDMEYDLQELRAFPRIVDVTEKLVPDYDYVKLQEEYANTILGNYIRTMQAETRDVVTNKALEYGVNALLGYQL